MENRSDIADDMKHKLHLLTDGNATQEIRLRHYDNYVDYEETMRALNYQSPEVCAEEIGKYITENRDTVQILDLGAGTGLVGAETMRALNYQSPEVCAEEIGKYITENRDTVQILDLGAGTGLVGAELQNRGFRIIDGLDPSKGMLQKAEQKNIYRALYCQFFNAEPCGIPPNTYDAICISGAFGKGDIHEDSVYEMIRLEKPGCIICFVGRKVSFENLLPLLDKLQSEKRLEKVTMYETDRYRDLAPGQVIVCRVI